MNIGNIGSLFDLAIVESLDGGELAYLSNDLVVINKKENQVYIAMFGGNVDQSQWWGNSLIMQNQPKIQYNSLTENTLNTTPLTSAGRRAIETAITKDLAFLKPTFIQVSIISDNRISCLLRGDFGEQIINFVRKSNIPGDFFFMDFNGDFY